MGGGITGNGFAALSSLAARLDASKLRRAALDGAAAKIGEVAAAQYARGAGPDDATWPSNRDGSVPLVSLTAQIAFKATDGGVAASGPDVLRYHERTRPVFPPPGELSGPWAAAAEEGAAAALDAALGKV